MRKVHRLPFLDLRKQISQRIIGTKNKEAQSVRDTKLILLWQRIGSAVETMIMPIRYIPQEVLFRPESRVKLCLDFYLQRKGHCRGVWWVIWWAELHIQESKFYWTHFSAVWPWQRCFITALKQREFLQKPSRQREAFTSTYAVFSFLKAHTKKTNVYRTTSRRMTTRRSRVCEWTSRVPRSAD